MNSKVWWKSKTIGGAIAMILSLGCRLADVEVMDSELQTAAEAIVGAIGFVMTIIGRKTASGRITLTNR